MDEEGASDDEAYAVQDEWLIRPSFYERDDLLREVERCQAEIARFRKPEESSLRSLKDATFNALTGFHSAGDAQEEFEKCGADFFFDELQLIGRSYDAELCDSVMAELGDVFPKYKDLIQGLSLRVQAKITERNRNRDHKGRRSDVDPFHRFLSVFIYVHGGLLQSFAPLLPGIKCSQSHFSRILAQSLAVVLEHWVPLYYRPMTLQSLLRESGLNDEYIQERQVCHEIEVKLRQCRTLIFIDGLSVPCEKSRYGREQKEMFDYSKDKQPVVRVLVMCDRFGRILHITPAVGGRTQEVEVAESMEVLEKLNNEAQDLGEKVGIGIVVDRGFYWFVESIKEQLQNFPWLHVEIFTPYHLVAPKKRGHKRTPEEKEEAKRKQFTEEQITYNRCVTRLRWINEVAVGFMEENRLFKRMIDLNTLVNIDSYFKVGAALANFRTHKRLHK
jgi:hypothetical protein